MSAVKCLFSYFSCIFSPKLIFAKRKQYTWSNVVLLILCLNSFLLIPLTLYAAQSNQVRLETFIPHSLDVLNQENFQVFQQGEIIQHTYTGQRKWLENQEAIVAVLPDEATMQSIQESKKASLVLTANEWYLADGKGQKIRFQVSGQQVRLSQVKTLSALKDFISQQWHRANFLSVFLLLVGLFICLMYTASILLIFGGAFFLRLAKKSALFTIQHYRECVGILLNCYGLPTLVSIVVSLVYRHPLVLLHIQMLGTILMLVFVFQQTHLRDEDDEDVQKIYTNVEGF